MKTKYILSDNIALRSWRLVPYAYYIKYERNANALKADEYDLLKSCDGIKEIEESDLLIDLAKRGLCRKAKENDTLTPWQKEKVCDNRYFPALNFMMTGKCNYNCLHCFNASDNNRITSEFSYEEAVALIEDAAKCGINAFTITGGEPMLHPRFMDIIKKIYEQGMYVEELNTNGYFLTKEVLDEFKTLNCYPLIKISFDGVGFHDWLRDKKGAEEDALRAIKLCIENGFFVMAQMNVNKKNIESMLPTAKLLNDMGVHILRLIRTTESPRWVENAGDSALSFEEYFDVAINFLEAYTKMNCDMDIDIWQFAHLYTRIKKYQLRTFECNEGEYRDTMPVCRGSRGMVAVASNGDLYPCLQVSGYYEKHNIFLGNVKNDGLQKFLQESEYLSNVSTTLKDLKMHNDKCNNCKWFKYCCGGCRTVGIVLTGDVYGSDISRCIFFNGGYIEKMKNALQGYENLTIFNYN